ncbi:tRNA guanosine(34) transglycosylase Tgt [Gammaproteobacteria bacterium]|nr:tRNA guanosine(34) transglycosylase Tgt [Gammaproteobacteria bacterium]
MSLKFEIIHRSKRSGARVGVIQTPHGDIATPGFVAVGTNGTLKALDNGANVCQALDLMFCNTYHLMLQPGIDVIEKAGGLHQFIGRNQPIITDSGGFQVFSLAYGSVADELKSKGTKKTTSSVLKISEKGVVFRSYRDGSRFELTPESSIGAQKIFGSDIIIPLDELPAYHTDYEQLKQSLDRTHRWEKRSLDAHTQDPRRQSIYSVIHGGICPELRKKSCQTLTKQPFDGHAIGGSLGKNHDELQGVLRSTLPYLPPEQPRHLLGLGDIRSIDMGVGFGMDTFDSAYPTRSARHGVLYRLDQEPVRIKATKYAYVFEPIEKGCDCYTCQNYTQSYLHHLLKAHEPVYLYLSSIHNVAFMARYMARIRQLILEGSI